MKKYFLNLSIIFVFCYTGYTQTPSNEYIFREFGTCRAVVTIRNDANMNLIHAFTDFDQVAKVQYPAVETFYFEYTDWTSYPCHPDLHESEDKDMSLLMEYMASQSIQLYWSPVISDISTISSINIDDDYDPPSPTETAAVIRVRDSRIFRAISEYTGNEFEWYIEIQDSGEIIELSESRNKTLTGKWLAQRIGFERKFYIRPRMPYHQLNESTGSVSKTFRPSNYRTQNLAVLPCDLQVKEAVNCSNSYTLTFPPASNTSVLANVQYGQENASGQMEYHDVVGYTDLVIYAPAPEKIITLNETHLRNSGLSDQKSFSLRLVYSDVPTLNYTVEVPNLRIYPDFSHVTYTTDRYCPDETGGVIHINRSSSEFTEQFELKEIDCIHEIKPAKYLNAGITTDTIKNVTGGPFCISQKRVIEDSLQCEIRDTIAAIIPYQRPGLSVTGNSPPSCADRADGILTVQTTDVNGSGDVTVWRKAGTGETSIDLTKLTSGAHDIVAIDDYGCKSTTVQGTVGNTSEVIFTLGTEKPLCYNTNSAKIFVSNISGGPTGTVSRKYYVDDSQVNEDAGCSVGSNICLGDIYSGNTSYEVKVSSTKTGTQECFSDSVYTGIIGQHDQVVLSLGSKVNVACYGDYSGELHFSATGGVGGYSYILTGPANLSNSTGDFTGLPAGSYSCTVTDLNSCTDQISSISISQPSGKITITGYTENEETCLNTEDGSIQITNVTGGTPGYAYSWSNGQTGATATGLKANTTYTVTITDAAGCDIDQDFDLDVPAAITAAYQPYAPDCPGESSGSFVINSISNGNPGYQYSTDNTTFHTYSPGVSISGLTPGSHTLYIRDSEYQATEPFSNCMSEIPVNIPDKQIMEIISDHEVPPDCYGESTGEYHLDNIDGPGNTGNYTFEWRSEAGTPVSTNRNLMNQIAGVYEVSIFDEESCEAIFSNLEITTPSQLVITNISVIDASCVEVEDAEISITASGGTESGNYEYSVGSGFSEDNNYIVGLSAGDYMVYVRDDNGCISSQPQTISAGELILNLDDKSVISCNEGDDGRIEVSTSGGSSNIHYYMDGPEGTTDNNQGIFEDLVTGNYSIYAVDLNTSCQTDLMNEEVNQPDPVLITISLIDSASCGQNTGNIDYSVEGGNGGYVLEWEHIGYGIIDESQIDQLPAGNYHVSAEDSKNCSAEESFTIPERSGPEITGHNVLEQTWCGLPLGSVEINIENGTPEFTYAWSHDNELNNATATNLIADTYEVTVTDQYNCSDIYSFELIDGPSIEASVVTTDANCGNNNGNATINASGGVSPYEYEWPASVSAEPVSNPFMENLYAGSYMVNIIDDVGCIEPIEVNIANLDGPEITIKNISKAWCGLPTGTAGVNVTGVAPPFTYTWREEGQSTVIDMDMLAENLTAGDYIFSTEDDEGCISIQNISIADSVELEPVLDLVSIDSSSCGQPTGSIIVNMTGGLSPYTYYWEHSGLTSNSISDLSAGVYDVTATDERGCIQSLEVELSDRKLPQLYLLATEDAYCGLASGKFYITATLGETPYTAYILGNEDEPVTLSYIDSAGSYIAVIDNLLPSEELYGIQAVDADGCESNVIYQYIDNFSPFSLSLVEALPTSCFGYSDGTATVIAEDGIEPYTYQWSENSINNSTNNLLSGGIFTVTVIDAEGCEKSNSSYSIPEPEELIIVNANLYDPICNGSCNGRIVPIASGGTGDLLYIWNNTDTTQNISDACSGSNLLRVIDEHECYTENNYMLTDPPALTETDLPDSRIICFGQEIILNPGEEWGNCSWSSSTGFSSTNHSVTVSAAGEYYLTAYSEEGCEVNDLFILEVSDNILNAEFLMMSEANVGDTVVIIEVSWPEADACSWDLPQEATLLTDTEYYKELIFREEGTYYVELNASLASCAAVQGKYIEIYNPGSKKSDQDWYLQKGKLIHSFNIYPNPVRDNLTAIIELDNASDIRLEMFSLTGGMLITKEFSGLDEYDISINVSDLRSGMYMLRLIADKETETKLFVVK